MTEIPIPRGKPAFDQDPHRVRDVAERNLEAAIGREVRNFRRQQNMTVADLAAMGVRRISTGSQIARVGHAAIRDATRGMLAEGSFAGLNGAASGDEIDAFLRVGAGEA